MLDLFMAVILVGGVVLFLAITVGVVFGLLMTIRIVLALVGSAVPRRRPRCACVCFDALCNKHPMIPAVIASYPCADATACPVHGPVVATAKTYRSRR